MTENLQGRVHSKHLIFKRMTPKSVPSSRIVFDNERPKSSPRRISALICAAASSR
ncbi:hypothetical protein BN871_CZ_00350 [Paenibacillus sp. P22]|nr:hypothetical protein BN871_CZ_00350 [Paenibacillus sp. P22]